MYFSPGWIVFAVLVIFLLASSLKVLNEYERGVVFRLGRIIPVKGPGLVIIWPIIDKLVRVSLRTITMDVPPQDVITRDNVSIKVSAVLYFRVLDPNRAIISVENYLYATSQLAQTTLRSILGQQELDELLSEREKFNQALQQVKVRLFGGEEKARLGHDREVHRPRRHAHAHGGAQHHGVPGTEHRPARGRRRGWW